ncbi:hypothetical protein BUALT_Bualt01G0044900 [Buddleja alternifolia]|uniref:Myb-like domain-containing protein n=1 Tax=Buddleja alternifolia TaxID=168488 RepID=A0AAV6YEY5_9LAMI|nr:hypothetical protein BUALT_Bualt01G0044900 [Buddleja alternifolia]
MRDRKSRKCEEQKPTIFVRRSPRFLHVNQSDIETPRTTKTAPRKIEAPDDSFRTPLCSSMTETRTKCGEISQKGGKNGTRIGSSGLGRLDDGANLCENEKGLNLRKEYVEEKRVTRSSIRRNEEGLYSPKQFVIEKRVTRGSVRGSEKSVINQVNGCSFEEKKENVGVNLCKYSIGKIEKRVTRSSSEGRNVALVEKGSDETPHERVIISERIKDGEECGIERKMHIGEKRKRYQVEEECEAVQGWSEEQELALQKAYLTAKPTPHFWKKVARMVPGKSAEECFDRIQSDHLTPSQPRTRSMANTKKPSPLSFSASKLLSPAETRKTKRFRPTKRSTLLAQKTVRSLLQKQQNEHQDYEPDFFSVLEPTINPSSPNIQAFASPTPNQEHGILSRFGEMSSSAHKKHFSRLNSLSKAPFVSPPVLKQVKNKALHEKYIDQLHCREAKRKAESLRNAKGKNNKKVSQLNVNSVKVAKDALVFDAQDAINQFRSLQSSMIDNIDEDNMSDSDNSDELC